MNHSFKRYIKSDGFFPDFLPHIKTYSRKLSRKNAKGNPTDFTDEEKKQIIKSLEKMITKIKNDKT